MKRFDILCASQASTAICSSMENKANPSSSSSAVHCPSDRAIDRHNPIIRDARRSARPSLLITPPCSSSAHYPPFNPIPYHQLHQKPEPTYSLSASTSGDDEPNKSQQPRTDHAKNKKRSLHSILTRSFSSKTETVPTGRKSVSSKPKLGHSRTTPSGSTRYLLGSSSSMDRFPDHDQAMPSVLARARNNNDQDQDHQHHHQIFPSKPTSSSLSSHYKSASNQVVVLRVSLHCKACEGKVRKHLSRMEGVASFNIDFAAKKVTVVGDITPVDVLASVSKVKNAQFWTSSSTQ